MRLSWGLSGLRLGCVLRLVGGFFLGERTEFLLAFGDTGRSSRADLEELGLHDVEELRC